MAFRGNRSRFSLSNTNALVRLGSLVWRRARWGWTFYRSKSWSRRDAEHFDIAYLAMREQLFDERQLASEAFYWATIRDMVEAPQRASARDLASFQPDDADDR